MGKRDFDNNLKYQGWDQMSTILDKEMPEKRRSKKLFFLIFLIPSLLFLIVSGINILENKKQNSSKFQVKAQVQKTKNNTKSIKSYNTYTGDNSQTIEEKSNTKISEKSSMKANSKIKINKTRINIKHKQCRKVQTVKNDFALSEFSSSSSNTAIKLINTGLSKTSKNDYITNISKLNSLPVPDLHTKQNIVYNPIIKLKKHKNIDLINPFAGTKMYIYSIKEEPKTKFGLEIGNRFSYSTRFFTDISLAYTQSQIVRQQIILRTKFISSMESSNYLSEKDSIVLNNRSSDLKFGTLHLSLDQGYRFSNKLSTAIGISIDYTKLVNKYDFSDPPSDSIEKLSGSTDITLDRIRYSSQINISYRILQNLSFNIGYKHYFNTIYKVKSSKDTGYSTTINNKNKSYKTYIGIRFWF